MKKFLFISTIFIFCIGICCIYNQPDNDLWARLIAGGHIVETMSILKYDFLSYTKTHPWYDHEWGASIFIYLALKYFGHNGLILLKGILSALTIFFCYKAVKIRNPLSTTPYNILYFIFIYLAVEKTLGSATRCLLFTCLFYVIFIYILEKVRIGNKKLLIILPIIMIFWSNIHGGCISGLGILSIYCVGEFLNKKTYKEYIITLLFCLAALFINPYGIEYVKFLFQAATMPRPLITEWANSFSHKYITSFLRYKIYLFIMLSTMLISIIKNKINYEKADKTKILLIVVMTYLSIVHIRHQSFFVFTAGIFLYDDFYELFNSAIKYIRKKLKSDNQDFINSFCLLKDIIIYFILLIATIPPLISNNKAITITNSAYPRYAIEFIKINKIKGNLFLNFNWGSYAAYKLYPNNLIVMDGRYEEVYNPDLLLEIRNFYLLKNDWSKIINEYKTDVMIIEKEYPIYIVLLNDPNWSLVFENNLSGVFVPTKDKKDKYIYPEINDDYYNKNMFETDIKFKKGDK